MYVLSMILPMFIRREKKISSSFEVLKNKGRVYCTTRDKPKRYFLMKKAYINKMKQGKENLTKETRKKK